MFLLMIFMSPSALLLLIVCCVTHFNVLIAYDHYSKFPFAINNSSMPAINVSLLWSYASLDDSSFLLGFRSYGAYSSKMINHSINTQLLQSWL